MGIECVHGQIRPATLREVGKFYNYVVETYWRGIDHALFSGERLGRDNEAFVAERNGQIVGMVTLAFDAKTGPTLDALYTVPDARSNGVGYRLCVAAVERFREREAVPVFCLCQSEDMVRLIERLPPELRGLVNADTASAHLGIDLPEYMELDDLPSGWKD